MREQAMHLTKLKTLGLAQPLGIDKPPAFSWIIESDTPNTLQAAYQITVWEGEGVIWDSGRVQTRRQAFVPYGGPALKSKTRYNWRLAVWDNHGSRAQAESQFETAFLNAGDWRAKWVESTIPRAKSEKYEYGAQPPPVLFSRVFSISRPVQTARLYATAYGAYRAMLNGVRPDDREFAPEHTVYRSILYYQCYDVTALLRPGENELTMLVGDGWYFCPQTLPIRDVPHAAPAVLYQLEIEYTDGSRESVASGGGEACRTGPILFSDIFRGEKQDANVPYGAEQPIAVMDYGYAHLRAQPMPPVRPVKLLPAAGITQSPRGEQIVDFGQVLCGRARVAVCAPKGTEISFEYFECPTKEGNYFNSMIADQKDIYISNGAPCVYEAVFTFHGFRYIRVTGWDAFQKEDFTAVVLSTQKENAGSFECSDERLNRLYENIRWSQTGNMLSIPTDCPSRERAGFTGDMQIYAPAAMLNEDMTPFLESWLENVAADQMADGAVPITVPFTRTYERLMERTAAIYGGASAVSAAGAPLSSGVAGWGDAAVLVPYEMYRLTGNRPVLEKHYGTMRRWADYVITTAARQRGDNDLPVETDQYLWNTGFQFGEWLIPSQPEAGADFAACKVSSVYTTPIFGWLSVNTMAKVAGILDRAEKTYYAEMADKMRAAIHRGLMADGNMPAELMGAYVLAAALDLTPPEHAQAFAGKLVQMLTQNGGCLDTGFLATPYLLDAFVKIGRRDLALGLLWQGKQPSWLFEVDNGATTIWESWFSKHADGAPQITSFNHYAFGCVDDWIFRHIAGIECTEPGFGHFSVRPLPDTPLAWCKRSFMSSCGEIAVHWTKDTLEVTVPCNAAATVHWKGKTLEAGSGKHIF